MLIEMQSDTLSNKNTIQLNNQESTAEWADMAAHEFDDRHTQIAAENEPYHQYEDQYQDAENESWAGALPVKQ